MKRVFTPGVKMWTDYPFTELGDKIGKIAPIREVTIGQERYDGNKYVQVVLENGTVTEVKSGYLHESKYVLEASRPPK